MFVGFDLCFGSFALCILFVLDAPWAILLHCAFQRLGHIFIDQNLLLVALVRFILTIIATALKIQLGISDSADDIILLYQHFLLFNNLLSAFH